MTYRDDRADDTHVVERERVVERPVEREYVERPTPVTNVNASSGYVAAAPGPLYYIRRIVALLFGILEVLLILRIVLLALAANSGNALVSFVYNVTEPFVAPFRGIFNFNQVSPGGNSTLDVAALVALVGWVLIEILVLAILRLGDRNTAAAA